jgi:osmotically-inducible protein OsmY
MKKLAFAVAMTSLLFATPVFAATPDGMLTSKTKLSLWTAAGVKSSAVHVDTDEGIVTLYGKVETAEQRAIAEKTARGIEGVVEVKNLLQIVPEAQEKRFDRSDKDLMDLAQQRLKAESALDDSKISVKSVDKGVVLLTGEARTFSAHLRAVALIDRIPGVRGVASEIKGPETFASDERIIFLNMKRTAHRKANEAGVTMTDMGISTAVKLRLLTAPQMPSTEIRVDTDDGVVTLFGMVPTSDIRNAAGAEAAIVAGVKRVDNELEVVATAQKQRVEAKDADISRDLTLAFKDRAELKGVSASVKNGTVRLTGTVGSGWDEVNAVRITRRVAGVRGVEDDLKINDKSS